MSAKAKSVSSPINTRTGAQILVDQLVVQGVQHVFCVPGESYLAVLDAFHDAPLEITVCRQEGGAAMMADASARLTGRPGIVFVTRGPGATNASPGIHIAEHDSSPVIMFIGQVQRDAREREAFQEVEYRRAFTEFAKWVGEIDDARRIPEFVTRAFAIATVFWGVVGFLMGVVIASELAWPLLNLDLEWTTFGRLRPVHTSAVIFAFGGNALICTSLYVVQRTCRARLFGGEDMGYLMWRKRNCCVL